MDRAAYHHGDLKQELIHKGLLLLNKEGIEGFSLRKVASMCGVSHNAPYKHFKDKDGLIKAIIEEIWGNFSTALIESAKLYPDDPKLQIIEMGKAYVKFMVENPEYFKLMFLSDNSNPIKIKGNQFSSNQANTFEIFKDYSEKYFKEINLNKNLYLEKILAMWSMVHGMAVLIIKKSIEYEGDYLELVERMLEANIFS